MDTITLENPGWIRWLLGLLCDRNKSSRVNAIVQHGYTNDQRFAESLNRMSTIDV